jgi:hypothetical protein
MVLLGPAFTSTADAFLQPVGLFPQLDLPLICRAWRPVANGDVWKRGESSSLMETNVLDPEARVNLFHAVQEG